MSDLGRLLRETRTAKEFTLPEVEAATRIRQKYLEALETGDYTVLPQGATTRGFLRNYARFLDVDPEEALRVFAAESGNNSETLPLDKTVQNRLIDYRPLEEELNNEGTSNGWWRWAMAALVVLVLGAGGWGFFGGRFGNIKFDWSFLSAFGPQRSAAVATATVTTSPRAAIAQGNQASPTAPAAPAGAATRPAPTSDLLPYPTPTLPPTATPTALPPTATAIPVTTSISMTMKITQRSWVLVTADGKQVDQGVFEPGTERGWDAQQTLSIRTGNAAGIDLTLNGQAIGAMGGVGQVMERAWVVDQGQIVEATPGTTPGAQAPPADTPTATATGAPAG
jgi:cytoskeleton protein RodZ